MPESNIWYQKACKRMVRDQKSLFLVSNELDLGLTQKQCVDIAQTEEFGQVLRGERNRFYKELASDPNRSKMSNVGNLLFCADQLIAGKQYDKAAAVLMNIMKAEGQLEDKSTVSIFGDVTQKDIAAMGETIRKRKEALN